VSTSVFVLLPATAFEEGERRVRFRVSDGRSFAGEFPWRLRGPEREADRDERERRP